MSDDYENLSDRIPDFTSAISNRLSGKLNKPPGTFDPYSMMIKKKSEVSSLPPSYLPQWPERDVQALQDYCSKMGIVGFSCGMMSPIAALAMLKSKMGDFSGVPLEERNPSNTLISKKQILHG